MADANAWEISAEILFLSIFTSLSTFFTTSCITLPKMLIKKRLVFFPSLLCICWLHLQKFCISWAFSWLIFILTMHATVCFVFAVLLLWTLSALLPQVFCFVFWIPSHAILLLLVISLILLDNFFCLENFSLLFQDLILRILTTLFILTDPNHNLFFFY